MRTNAHCRPVDREIRHAGNQKKVTLGPSRASAMVVTTSRALAGAAEGKHAAAAAHGGGTFFAFESRHVTSSPGSGCHCVRGTNAGHLSAFSLVTGPSLRAVGVMHAGGVERFSHGGRSSVGRALPLVCSHAGVAGSTPAVRPFFFARHVTIAGRSAGGIVSGFESCGARLSRGASSAASEQAGHAELVRAGCESPALHQWEWPVGPLAGSAPKGEAGTFFGSVADRERHRAVNAAALPSGGSIPPRPTTSARRVAGHQLAGVGVVVADDAQGIGLLAGAGFRGGHGIHSHTAQATRRSEGESRASVSGNEGLSCLRHLTRARPVRRIPNSVFSLPLALDAAASGRGARIFFQVNA